MPSMSDRPYVLCLELPPLHSVHDGCKLGASRILVEICATMIEDSRYSCIKLQKHCSALLEKSKGA